MKRQQSSQMPLRKSLWRKASCLNCYLIKMKVSYSWWGGGEVILTSKGEKQVPGFKAQKNRLILLFCANVVRFMIEIVLIYRAVNLQALNGKDKYQLTIFCLCNKKSWTLRKFFLSWFHWCFVPEVRKYLSSKGLSFKSSLILDNAPEPNEFNIKRIEEVCCCC